MSNEHENVVGTHAANAIIATNDTHIKAKDVFLVSHGVFYTTPSGNRIYLPTHRIEHIWFKEDQ